MSSLSNIDAEKDRSLSRSLMSFIHDDRGSEIGTFTARLGQLGEVAIFGGMARDFAMKGDLPSFESDVDIVVDCASSEVEHFLQGSGAVRNRFGGYRLVVGRFDVDLWTLPDTWACAAGHVEVRTLADLIKTTFFDCDAVVFHCRSGEISRLSGFWDSLKRKEIDINLEPNPHPAGAVFRALRARYVWGKRLSPRLQDYVSHGLQVHFDEIARMVLASAEMRHALSGARM